MFCKTCSIFSERGETDVNKLRQSGGKLFALSLLCSLAALVLVICRVRVEITKNAVCPVMSYEDISSLAEASNETAYDWCVALSNAGLQGVLMTPEQMLDAQTMKTIADAGLSPVQVGGLPQSGPYFFALCYDETVDGTPLPGIPSTVESLPLEEILQALHNSDSFLVLVENEAQTGMLLPEGWDATHFDGKITKACWLNSRIRCSAEKLGYAGMEETENILFRAVIDRGVQFAWIAPVTTPEGKTVIERSKYVALLSGLETRLKHAGFSYGKASAYAPDSLPSFLWILTGLAVLFGTVLLIEKCFRPVSKRSILVLSSIGIAEEAIGFLAFPHLQITALALLAAIVFPCLSVIHLGAVLSRADRERSFWRWAGGGCLGCVGFTLWGALLIAALQSGRDYLLVLRLFRGVKLSQAAVYLFSVGFFSRMYFRSQKPVPGQKRSSFRNRYFRNGLLLALFLTVGVIYLLRTGDRMMPVSVAEQRIRNWLEHCLLFRPRAKEYLIAWPFLGLAFLFEQRGKTQLSAFFGAFSGIGFASLVNTFCHSRSHFLISLARTGIGLILGFVLALILIGILHFAFPNHNKEFSNDQYHSSSL